MPSDSNMVMIAPAPSVTSWLVLLAPVLAWSAQELLSYAITATRCVHGQPAFARGILIDVSALALTTSVAACVFAVRGFRRIRADRGVTGLNGREREELLAVVSVVLGVVLTLAIVWGALPSLLVSHICEAGA